MPETSRRGRLEAVKIPAPVGPQRPPASAPEAPGVRSPAVPASASCTARPEAEAAEAEMATIALSEANPALFFLLGAYYQRSRRFGPATTWYRRALSLAPALVAAHRNLAAILELEGRADEARHHRDEAYGRQSVFVDDGPPLPTSQTVLLLCTAVAGNVPFEYLLPRECYRRIEWVMEYASPEQADTLPDHGVVFNAIGDADAAGASRETVEAFLERCRKPVFNSPASVAMTARDRLPGILGGIDDALVLPTVRLRQGADAGENLDRLSEAGLTPPLLMRPVGAHGGQGLVRIDGLEAAALGGGEARYACPFMDFRSPDGYWRKYRMIFVDRRPYPYHLAISDAWMVHYQSADMLSHAWKREEEARFLAEPERVVGRRGMAALRAIGKRLNLDFCGIDFAVLPDGRILVFEANATMLVHLEDFHETLKFKNAYVQRILDAFAAMLTAGDPRSTGK